MNTYFINSKKLVLLVAIAFVAMCLLPLNTMVAYAAPEDNVTVEYRYTEGDAVEIPTTIMQLGREYRLLSRAEPVLESTLPQVRTYNYRITGALTSAEAAILQNADPYLSISPVDVVMEREVDKTRVLSGRPTNDVDSIPMTDVFEVTSATAPSGKENVILHRAGIEFEVQSWEAPQLPGSYRATVIYRGIETYNEIGYYLAENTYQSQVTEGESRVFIIVATYEPTDLDQEVVPVAGPTTTEQPPAPLPPETPSEFTEEQLALLDSQTPLSSGPFSPIKNIVDGLTPLGGLGITSAWSVASMFMALVAFVLASIRGIGMIGRKNRGNGNGLIKLLAVIFGALTPITWLFVDNMSQPQVWINKGTTFVGIIFLVHLVLFFISKTKRSTYRNQAEEAPNTPVAEQAPTEPPEQAVSTENAGGGDNTTAA